MEDVDLYIRVATAILGITYPILLQVVARLDEKYSSTIIVQLFDKEFAQKWFKNFLISSLIAVVIKTLKFKPLITINNQWNYIISNSANLLVIINSILLVITFFFFVERILIYYIPIKFFNLLKDKYNKTNEIIYFTAISDIFLLAIQKQNSNLTETIARFLSEAFNNERIISEDKPVEYPQAYYTLVYKTVEELSIQKSKRNINVEYFASGGIWLLGEINNSKVSERTYAVLWNCLLLSVKFEQDEFVLHYWETANKYFTYSIGDIREEIEGFEGDKVIISNKEQVEENRRERERFLEFNYALGGLLLYKKRYECLNQILKYTTSQPPEYKLLPNFMNEIFEQYVKYNNPYDLYFTWISKQYPFPGLIGMEADYEIKRWICLYFSVLFLRQYSLQVYYVYSDPLGFPHIPQQQSEKQQLLNSLDYFKKLLNESLNNAELIKELDYDFITQDWSNEHNKLYPLTFIDELKQHLQTAYEASATNLTLSHEKIQNFYDASNEILGGTLSAYNDIINADVITEQYNSLFINSGSMIEDKDAFSENPEVHHMNYDTFLATDISNKIKNLVANCFSRNRSKSYLIEPEELFLAIDKLNVNSSYVIASLGVDIPHHISFYKTPGLTETSYNNVPIIKIAFSGGNQPSLFILKRVDLPNIISTEIHTETIEKYSLEKISDTYNIYASVLDLNAVPNEFREEMQNSKTEEELRKSVLLIIGQSTEVRFKNNISLIRLMPYSKYLQEGSPNNLNDVVPV